MVQAKDSRRPGTLTASQQLIWAGQQLSPESPLYNMALAVTIEGPLDASAFAEAFRALVGRNDALRTVFGESGGVPERRVLGHEATPPLAVSRFDGSVDDLLAALGAAARTPFAQGRPLFDASLFSVGTDRWLFFLNQHHLITDAWATGALYRQLSDLYIRTLDGRLDAAGEKPSFDAFAEHEAAERVSRRYEKAARHWRESATAGSRRLSFYGKTAPATDGRTDRYRRRLDRSRTSALRALASRDPFRAMTPEQSLFQIFVALLTAWVHRVADVSRVSIGTPWHNRSTARFRDTLGLFVELYPVRLELEADGTLAGLVGKAAAAGFDMMRHAVPGCSLLPQTRDFEVVLNVITASLGDFAGLPARSDWIHSGYGDPAHTVRLQVYDFDRGGEITLDFDLNASVFSGVESVWAVDHFMRFLDALLADPGTQLDEVELTTWDEAASFMPATTATGPPPTVVQMFRRQATETPDATALIDGGRACTYAELAALVEAARARLAREGASPGSVVAVCVEHSVGLVSAWLGALAAGAAFVPLDPRHPDDRIAHTIRDAGAAIVVVNRSQEERPDRWGARRVLVEDLIDRTDGPVPSPAAAPRPEQLAYILYTSGSTGSPKGVEVSHGSLADYAAWAARVYCGGEALAFPLFTSPAFDLTLTSVFAPLVSGGSVIIYRQDSESDFVVRRVFEDNRVDVVKLTPSHLALIRDLPLDQSRVRRLIVGGEDLKTELAASIARSCAGTVDIINEYGPTEATVGCAIHHYRLDGDVGGSVPVGVPADNTRIYVLDPKGRPAPRGVSGEICIAGARVARGYRNRPQDTAASFVADPRSPGALMYRSGDRGRWNAGGDLEFLGRRDAQVKVRGVRVELGEVEAALADCPGVDQAVVVLAERAVEGDGSRCRVCGLESRHPEARLDSGQVCAVCRGFEAQRNQVTRYFGTMADLRRLLGTARATATGRYDTLMLFSGGKDSTYALCSVVELGARPLVFLLDNGYISDQAKQNVRRVVDLLGLDLHVATTPAMPEIFADSLRRYSNVCNGCFKTIYTLATNLALEHGIHHVVTGLSRGQIFETRLAEIYRRGIFEPEDVDRTVIEARKAYHRMEDAVSRALDCTAFSTDDVFEDVRFVDFYRYCDTPLDEMLDYLARRTPWLRPSDTGRSTNCLINEAGISVHTQERGFHNYSMPYSWDVRLGHKQRDPAIEELDDPIDPARVERILRDIGYERRSARATESALVAYYVADADLPGSELRGLLERRLPTEAIPMAFVRLDAPPLTPNGKVDRRALAAAAPPQPAAQTPYVAPHTGAEATLARLWADVLRQERVGINDNFFELGGDSIQCVQIVAAAREHGLAFTARDLFSHPTIAALVPRISGHPETVDAGPASQVSRAEMDELLNEFGDDLP